MSHVRLQANQLEELEELQTKNAVEARTTHSRAHWLVPHPCQVHFNLEYNTRFILALCVSSTSGAHLHAYKGRGSHGRVSVCSRLQSGQSSINSFRGQFPAFARLIATVFAADFRGWPPVSPRLMAQYWKCVCGWDRFVCVRLCSADFQQTDRHTALYIVGSTQALVCCTAQVDSAHSLPMFPYKVAAIPTSDSRVRGQSVTGVLL